MSGDFSVRAQGLGKCYQIYNQPLDRLKQSLWRSRRMYYREFWALRDVGFEIKKGETVGIIGSNGSGKSTLLQLMCGTVQPTEGKIEINGRVAALLELGAGFDPEYSGRENVYVHSAIMGLTRAETDACYDEVIDFADIGNFIDQPVKTYSTGMYVRLAFAAAVNVRSDLLLVDEVLSVGDVRFQQKCMAKMRQFCQEGTVIFVSHDTAAITELCSRVFWIEQGRLRLDGEPKFVSEKYLQYMYEGDMEPEKSLSDPPPSLQSIDSLEGFAPVAKDIRQFGNRKATIESVRLISPSGSHAVVYAEHECEISMLIKTHEQISRPLAGYLVKDRLGRDIFGDNTALMNYSISPLSPGKSFVITFRIETWPNLPDGDYSISVAIGDGSRENHVPCHWLHDAFLVRSIPVRPPVGIFSVPNTQVTFLPVKK